MNKNKSYIGNIFRYAAVVFLTAILFFNNSVKADETAFHSDTCGFSANLPDGFMYTGNEDGDENFIKFSSGKIQLIIVSVVEDTGITQGVLRGAGDTFAETFLSGSFGDESMIKNKQSYGIQEYGDERNAWFGLGLDKEDQHMDVFLTFNDQTDLYYVCFVNATEEDRTYFMNSFVFENSSGNTGFTSSAEADYTIPAIRDETDSDSSEMVPYTVKNGTYKLFLPSTYDVLIKGQDVSEETASAHSITQEKLAAYVSLSYDELIAVPQNKPISDCDTISLKIKEDKYPEVGNLKDLSSFEKTLIANAIISGMNTNGSYELYETGDVCFIVFEFNVIYPELRYATIIDDDMIYLYYKAESTGEINEKIKNEMKKIADTFSYEG